jgi:hypothetical protein
MTAFTETITWRPVADGLPDAELNVLLKVAGDEPGTCEGFLDGEWEIRSHKGMPLFRDVTALALPPGDVTRWAEMPSGTDSGMTGSLVKLSRALGHPKAVDAAAGQCVEAALIELAAQRIAAHGVRVTPADHDHERDEADPAPLGSADARTWPVLGRAATPTPPDQQRPEAALPGEDRPGLKQAAGPAATSASGNATSEERGISGVAPSEVPSKGHCWHDYGKLGGENVSWCSVCDALAFTGREPSSPCGVAVADGDTFSPRGTDGLSNGQKGCA